MYCWNEWALDGHLFVVVHYCKEDCTFARANAPLNIRYDKWKQHSFWWCPPNMLTLYPFSFAEMPDQMKCVCIFVFLLKWGKYVLFFRMFRETRFTGLSSSILFWHENVWWLKSIWKLPFLSLYFDSFEWVSNLYISYCHSLSTWLFQTTQQKPQTNVTHIHATLIFHTIYSEIHSGSKKGPRRRTRFNWVSK